MWPMNKAQFEVCRLGELLLVEPQSGIRQHDQDRGKATPYVTTGTVSQGTRVLRDVPSNQTFGDVKGRVVEEGDLLLVSRGVERVESVPCVTVRFQAQAAYSESLIRLRVDSSRADPDYLRMYLTSRQGSAALAAAATGSVISNLRREALQEVEISLPELETQKQVATIITGIERQIDEFQATFELLQELYDTAREGFAAGILMPGNPVGQKEDDD